MLLPGLEDLFGYWRAWALGRHFRFLPLDQEVSEVLGGVEALQWGNSSCCFGTGKLFGLFIAGFLKQIQVAEVKVNHGRSISMYIHRGLG